jgi:hypothetical protein
VDLTSAARAAKDAIGGLRKAAEYRGDAAQIVARHASPDRDARFVNDRQARRRVAVAAPVAQLSWDL